MLHNQHSPGERVGGEVVRGGEGVYIGGAHQGETQPQRVDTKVIVSKRKNDFHKSIENRIAGPLKSLSYLGIEPL